MSQSEKQQVYDEDAGVIRCVCGFDDDDGFTIQCEKCYVWQHAQCVDISKENVPEIYYCDQCGNLKVDVAKAVERQKQRLANEDKKEKDNEKKSKAEPQSQSQSQQNQEQQNQQQQPQQHQQQQQADNKPEKRPTTRRRKTKQKSPPDVNTEDGKSASGTGRGRRLTEQNSKHTEEDHESDTEPDSRYLLSSASYKSYYIPIMECLIPENMREYWNVLPEVCKNNDDATTVLTEKEFDQVQRAKVVVKLVDSRSRFHGFSKYGLLAESMLVRDRFLLEFIGEVSDLSTYKSNPINQYAFYGCPKFGVLFMPHLNIAVDGRFCGSEASFMRRTCHQPNVKISPIVVKNEVHFGAFALEVIKSGQELLLAWEWDPKHPAYRLANGEEENFSKEEKQCLYNTCEAILQRGMDCACSSGADCILIKMKRLGRQVGENGATTHPDKPESKEGYSAREERKLAEAIGVMDRMDQQQHSKKRKSEEIVAKIVEPTPPTPPPPPPLPKVVTAEKAIQTEPVPKPVKRVKLVPSPHQSLMERYKACREDYLARPKPVVSKPPSAASSPPPLPATTNPPQSLPAVNGNGNGMFKPYSLDLQKQHHYHHHGEEKSGSTTPTTPLSGPVFEPPMATNVTATTSSSTQQPVSAAPLQSKPPSISGPSTTGSMHKPKKKLSLADYKKKQKKKD